MYNNLMYGMIAHLAEKVGGKSWEELLQDNIFDPLGMDNTTFTHAPDISSRDLATPYLKDGANDREISLDLHK